MAIRFKTTKIAGRAQGDPALYEILRDIGISGEELADGVNAADARLVAVEAILADGDKGDLTVSGTGTVWTIDPLAVTYPKIQQVTATSRLLGRASAGAGVIEEIALGTGLTLAGTTLNAAVTAAFPTGGIVMWGTTTAPTGFVLCDGTAISRTTYSDLFTVIGTTYGAGNGTTTFNVPDMRQRFPLGKAAAGTGSTLAGTGGAIDHLHSVDIASFDSGADFPAGILAAAPGGVNVGVSDTPHIHDVNPPSTNTSTNNPPFLALNFIIKT